MRILLFIALLLFSHVAMAQKPAAYFYTKASERYFSDAAMDTTLYETTRGVFLENKIPSELFERKYTTLKPLLLALSRTDVVASFKWVESTGGQSINAPRSSTAFEANRKLYEKYFVKEIRDAFNNNKVLSQYLSFNTSDRITYFNTTVRVGMDGKLLVEENISVHNGDGRPNTLYGEGFSLEEAGGMNDEIKRGIVRAFPIYYINEHRLFQNTTFVVKQVLRDGKNESYHVEKKDNGILLYTGSSDVFLENGNYTYTIIYETDYQLKFLRDFDELYWNVTGNGWSFRIDSAACKIILPNGIVPLSNRCYTGEQGSNAEDCSFVREADSSIIYFKTSRPLPPKNGFTIATSWKKGIVQEPGMMQKARSYIWNNKAVFFLPIAALFSAIFCFFYWWRVGRDPEKGTVYPQYDPPAGFSPASLGYIFHQRFDRQLTAATIVDAAVRNKIKIDVGKGGFLVKHNVYTISKSDKASKPPYTNYDDYHRDIQDLVGTTIEKGKYNKDLGSLNTRIQTACEKNYKNKDGYAKKDYKGFFALNRSYTTIPVLLCIVAAIWAFAGGVIIALNLQNFWQVAFYAGGIVLCCVVLKIFSRLLRAYSPEGRQLVDKIEGFRMFLSTADEPRLNLLNPPGKSLELYEKYLPFAIALGCEIEWGKQFEKIIESAYLDGSVGTASSFSSSFARDSSSFSSSFASSFSGAISSASTPPSSSSSGGSSGGGSSGGGGGGGGGGGW